MILKNFITILLLTSPLFLWAQYDDFLAQDQQPSKTVSFSFVPHYVLFNGLRFDIDYRNDRKAYVFTPQLYYVHRQTHPVIFGEARIYQVYGAGFGFFRKFIRSSSFRYTGYFAIGVVYNFFATKFKYYIWSERQLYDNIVKEYTLTDISAAIHRIHLDVTFGLQQNIANLLFVEGFIGVGYRYSMPFYSLNIENPLDGFMNYAYSGPIFIIGVKFGITKNLSKVSAY